MANELPQPPKPYVPPSVEPVGSIPELTFGAAPAVPIDTTFINARPIGVTS